MNAVEIARLAKSSTTKLQALPEEQRHMALESMAQSLEKNIELILEENKKDLDHAKANGLSTAIIDRLSLTKNSVTSLSKMCREVAHQEQVVGTIVEQYSRPNGLIIQKQRIPIGVIGMIFESRPNVIVEMPSF
jgi:glutamate-5-semialdehyde dehydrogenase